MANSMREVEPLGWEGWSLLFVVMAQALPIGIYVLMVGIEFAVEAASSSRRSIGPVATFSYDPGRLMLGLGLAMFFGLVAVWLMHATDWGHDSAA